MDRTAHRIFDGEKIRFRSLHLSVLLIIICMALVQRVSYVSHCTDTVMFSDMLDYETAALNFLNGRGLIAGPNRQAFRPPLYPLFIAAVYYFKASPSAVRYVQAGISAVTCGLVYIIGLIIGSQMAWAYSKAWQKFLILEIIPVCSALAVLFSSSHIFYTGILLSENLFTCMLMVWILLLLLRPHNAGVLYYILSGGWLGLMVLVRPGSLIFLPVLLALPFLSTGMHSKTRVTLYMVVSVLSIITVMAPWTIRNALLLKSFVPVSTNGGWMFYRGHHEDFGGRSLRKKTDLNEIALEKYYYRLGFQFLKNNPQKELMNSLKKIRSLYHSREKPWPMGQGREFYLAYPSLEWGYWLFFLAAAGLLIELKPYPYFRYIILSLLLLNTLLCIVFLGHARYRAPLEPLLLMSAIYGAFFVVRLLASSLKRLNPGPVAGK